MGEDILWRHTGIGTWEGEVWRDTAAPEPSPHPGGAPSSQQDAEGATSPDLSVPPESHGGSPARTHSSPPASQGPQAAGKPLSPPQPPTRPPNPWRNKAPPPAQWGWEDEAGPRTNELKGAWPPTCINGAGGARPRRSANELRGAWPHRSPPSAPTTSGLRGRSAGSGPPGDADPSRARSGPQGGRAPMTARAWGQPALWVSAVRDRG